MKKVRNRILLIVLIVVLAVAVAAGITWGVKKGSDTAVAASKTFTVGSDEYDDFSSAMDAARASSSSAQKTVTMNADYTLTSVYTLDAGYFVTLDLNGHTLDASSLKQAIVVYGTFTLDDSTGVLSTLTSGTVGVSRTSSGTKPYRTVYTSSSFSGKEEYNMYDGNTTQSYKYYESGAIICSSNGGINYSYYESGTVTVLQNGTFNMYGGTLTGGSAYYGAAVTVSGSDSTGSGYSPVFNMYGGSISGNSVTMVGGALFMTNGGEAYLSGGIIAHNTASNSSSGGAAIAVTGGGCSLTLGEYKSGLDIRTPLVISHNTAGYGAAIVMDDGVFLYIYDGTEISNNYATGSSTGGGAMYLHDTQGYMYGGSIIDNTCKTKGGAVYLTSSTFTMSGGDLTFNGVSTCAYSYGSQPDYGGNFYLLNSTFEMTGGSLVSGVASIYGGGLYIDGGTASVTGGEILGSASYTGGAGVYIAGGGAFTLGGTGDIILNSTTGTCGAGVFVASGTTFTMTGGKIEKNLILMGSYGGAGVYVDGTFEMTGGEIENNMCQLSGNGGGVYLSSSGVMYLYGGSISGNSAATSAGGVYDAGSLHVMGKVTTSGNTSGSSSSSNIYLINGKYITLDGVVSSGSEIGISFANSSQTQVTTEESSTSFYMQSYFYFSMDSASSGYMMGYSGAYVEKIATSSLSYYVNVNGSAQYCIGLSDALYLSSETNSPVMLNAEKVDVSSSVTVEAGWNSSIDLGGKTLSFASGVRLVVYGTLTVRDSAEVSGETSEAGASTVSNGDGTYTTTYSTSSSSASGRGVAAWHTYTSGALTTAESSLSTGFIDVFAGGTFNLEGGHITGGAALYASVFNVSGTSSSHAKLNITGGAVAGNKSGYYGAIFATHADVFITGGVIAGNTGYTYSKKDYNYSGALTISTDAYLTVGGGAVISGNTGAAIIYSLDGTVTVEESAELSGNTLLESSMGYGGVVAMSGDSTLYLYGGRIIENVVANFGAVGLSGSSGDVIAYAAGDAAVCFNYMEDAQTERNLYFNAGTETFVIEAGFSGYIGVTISLSLKEGGVGYTQVALNSAGLSIDEVRAVIFSDEGCECIHPEGDGYIYFYEKHVAGGLVMDTSTVIDGKVDAYHTCLFCGDRGDDYEGDFSYGYDDDGRAVIYAVYEGVTYYSYLSSGIMVTSGSDVSTWYSDAEYFNLAELSGGETIKLLSDAGDLQISVTATLVLNGFAVSSLDVTGGALTIEGDGKVSLFKVTAGTAELYGGTYYDDVLSYVKWDSVCVFVGENGSDIYYEIIDLGAVPENSEALVTYTLDSDQRTMYYECLSDGGEVFGFTGAEITLLSHASVSDGITVSATVVKINLSGFTLTADVTVTSAGSLIVTDCDDEGNVGIGGITGEICVEASGALVILGGTYTQDIFSYVDLGTAGDVKEYVSSSGTFTVGSEEVVKKLAGSAVALVTYIDGTYTVDVYYDSIDDAFSFAGEASGSCVKLLADIESSSFEITAEGVELNLAGMNLNVALTLTGGSLRIVDSGEDGLSSTGKVTGSVTASNGVALTLLGGTYEKTFFDGVTVTVEESDYTYVVVLNVDDTFTVMTDEAAARFAKASVKVEGASDTYYYETFEEAVAAALEAGGEIKLFDDIELGGDIDIPASVKVTFDLNGHILNTKNFTITVNADITESDGSVLDENIGKGAKLEICDSSTGTGYIYGTIEVVGTHKDLWNGETGDSYEIVEENNPYKETLKFTGNVSMNSFLTVDISSFKSDEESYTVYYFALVDVADGGNYYGITSVHRHIFNIAEWNISELGEISFTVICSCGEIYTVYDEDTQSYGDEAVIFTVTELTPTVDKAGGTVTYVISQTESIWEEAEDGSGNLEMSQVPTLFETVVTIYPVVVVTVGDDTYYLEDESYIGLILTDGSTYENIEIELWADIKYDFVFTGATVSLDLGTHTLTGDLAFFGSSITVSSGGGSIAGDITLSDSSSFETAEDSAGGVLYITGDLTLDGTSNAIIKTYGGDVSGNIYVLGTLSIETSGGGISGEKIVVSGSDASLTISSDENLSAYVAADITVEDGATLEIELPSGSVYGNVEAYDSTVKINLSEGDIVGSVSVIKSTLDIELCGSLLGDVKASDESQVTLEVTSGDIGGSVEIASSDASITLSGGTMDGSLTVSGFTEANDEGGVKINLGGGKILDGLFVSGGAIVSLDLDGGKISGGITVGENRTDTDTCLYIEDSVGSGYVSGFVAVSGGTLQLLGGTYEDAAVTDFISDPGLAAAENADGTYSIVEVDDAEDEYYAKVETASGAYVYFESVQGAVNFASSGGIVILIKSRDESVVVYSGYSVTLDLSGNTLTGSVTVQSGAYLLVTDYKDGEGLISGRIAVVGTLEAEAGSFTQSIGKYVVSTYREKRVLYAETSGSTLIYTIVTAEKAEDDAAASVTSGGVTVYYADISEAVAAVTNSSTITLFADVETGTIAITASGVTMDLNGHTVSDITVGGSSSSGASLTLTGTNENAGVLGAVTLLGTSSALTFTEDLSISGGIEVLGTDAFIYLGGAVVTSGLEVSKATLNLDLDGGTLKGNITVSSDQTSEYAVLVISDSSADAGIGDGMVDGKISGVSSDISVEAGTFTDENAESFIASGSSCLIGEGGVVIALDETYAEDFSEAYSVEDDGTTTYYTTFLSAAEHLAYTGGKIVLTASSSMSHSVEIWAAMEVEIGNSSLFVDLIINADEGGSLSVSMAALTDGELSASPLTGKIVIKGEGQDAGTENKYVDTLVFTDGVRPVGDLEIDLDALDGENCGGYMVGEKDFAGSGVYGITTGNTHIHVFDIETWKIDYDGRVTLLILCACGEAEDPDEDDDYIAKTVEITENADGSYTFRAEVIVGEGEDEKTYVCDKTVFFAATVVDVKGKTYYFESLQEAVDFVSDYDGCEIALKRDIEESVVVSAGSVEIDLNGKTWTSDGNFVVEVTGGNLVIYGEGTILGDIYGTARLRGGSYSFGGAATLADFEKGYVAFITTDGLCVIKPKSEAQNNSAASVLTGDVLSYYESLEDAVGALEEGSTLTLWADASEKFIEISSSITLDLGGFGIGEIEASARVTILGSGFVDTLALAKDGSFILRGGTFDDEAMALTYVDTEGGYAVMVSGGLYTVMTCEGAISLAEASITLQNDSGEVTLYFESLQSALDYACVNEITYVTMESDVSGDIEISSDVTLDLNYHTLDGNISVSEYIRFEISDNSDGEGTLTGEILPGDGALVTLSGGAYAYDTAVKFKDETFVLFQRYDGYYLLMTENEAMERCGVYILNGVDKAYYETIYGAVAAFTDGDTIYLNADTSFAAVIENALVIDVSGYTLTLDVEIEADESGTLGAGGSLTLTCAEGVGKVKGEIIVLGLGDASMDVNSYSETLVLRGGLIPSENLSVDLTNLSNSSNGGYFFSKVNEGETYYRVAAAFEHVTHEYEIEVWDFDENGNLVLYLMCACGLYESDVYGMKTGYISGDFEIKVSGGTVTYEGTAVDGEEKVHAYFSTFEYVASISLSNGVTLYFESLYTALDYSSAHGGTIKLEKDVREDVTAWDKGLMIDLNGHTLEGAVTLLAGSSMTIQNTSADRGTLKSAITSSGTLTLEGNLDVVFTGDAYGSERGRIIISGEVNFNLSGHTFTGAPEFEDGTTFTISGGDFVLVWDVSMQDGVTMVVSGDVNMDLSGYDFSGKIEVEEGATLVVTDSSSAQSGRLEGNVSAGAGAFVEMRRGVVDISDIVSGNLAVDTAEGYVFESAAQGDGETFYRIVTKDAHLSSGHGLDIETGVWEFDPGYSILTVHFRCLCGEETEHSFYLSEDYYSSYVEYEPYEELLPDGTTQTIMLSQWVVVSYEISSSVTGPNGVTYTFTAYGDVLLPGFNEEGDGYYIIPGYEEYYVGGELCGYRYTCIQEAGCNVTGVDMYEYNDGKGVIIVVTSGAYHRGIFEVTSETEGYEDLAGYDDRYDIYVCPKCGKIFINSSDTVEDKGYSDLDSVVDDMDRSDAFEDQKDSLKDGLDEAMTGCMGEAGGSVSQSYEKAMDELDDWEFEFDGGEDAASRERYLQYLMDNIDAIFAWAEMEIAKTEQATIAENLITDTYYELLYSGMYDEDALTREFEDIMQYLDALYCEAIEDVEDVYTAYIEKSIRDLTNLDILPGSTLESSDDGVEGTIYIEGTVGGMTELVITRDLINTSLDDKIADGTLVPADETFDADLESLVGGKKVLGVYTVKLWNEAEGGELSLFEGSYTITIKLSSLLKDADGLQILYVGDDGRIEVYETTISEDGEWISFTTTHLSQFVVVGSEGKDMSTMIIFLEVLLWIEAAIALALLIVFLIRRFRGGTPGRKAKKVASFGAAALLLGVFPAATTLNIVLFAVADAAFIAVIMLLVYALMSQKKKNESLTETDEEPEDEADDKKDKK